VPRLLAQHRGNRHLVRGERRRKAHNPCAHRGTPSGGDTRVMSRRLKRGARQGLHGATAAACLALTVCAGPPATSRWLKAGADDATTTREVNDCQAQANAAQNNQQGINQDISSTLGRNWAMSYTTSLHDETMRQQAASAADQAFNNCMLAKGFAKRG
jgi:hypothetical protein